jgi:hypothetical protein
MKLPGGRPGDWASYREYAAVNGNLIGGGVSTNGRVYYIVWRHGESGWRPDAIQITG